MSLIDINMDSSKKILIISMLAVFVTSVFFFWQISRPSRITSIIKDFDFNDSKRLKLLASVSGWGQEAIPFLKPFVESESDSERLAAVISLLSILEDKSYLKDDISLILKELKDDGNDGVRMFAGKGLISQGEKQGIEMLISCLRSEEIVVTEPGQTVKEKARLYLIEHTDYDGINYEKWENWWANNGHLVEWDGSKEFKLNIPKSWPF